MPSFISLCHVKSAYSPASGAVLHFSFEGSVPAPASHGFATLFFSARKAGTCIQSSWTSIFLLRHLLPSYCADLLSNCAAFRFFEGIYPAQVSHGFEMSLSFCRKNGTCIQSFQMSYCYLHSFNF
jgi:hypothetical protein